MRAIKFLGCLLAGLVGQNLAVLAQLNAWTNALSARWEEPYWSAGVLPGPAQTVMLTNGGYKAVGIWPSTAADFPATLTVSNLTIGAPTDGLTTLLLNYSGTEVPLHIRGSLRLETNGTLANFYGALQVDAADAGRIAINGGRMMQEGGAILARTASTFVPGGSIAVTNADVSLGPVVLGGNADQPATFTASGGTVTCSNVVVRNGLFTLLNGNLQTDSGIMLTSPFGNATLRQAGGTNVSNLTIGQSYTLPGLLVLEGGELRAEQLFLGHVGKMVQSGGIVFAQSNVLGDPWFPLGSAAGASCVLSNGVFRAGSWWMVNGRFEQYGGEHTVSNGVALSGYYRDDHGYITSRTTAYLLADGLLAAPSLRLDYLGSFSQTGGSNLVSQTLLVTNSLFSLSGGTLADANTVLRGNTYARGLLAQSGGTHRTGALALDTGGSYLLSGGYLDAAAIQLGPYSSFMVSNSPTVKNDTLQFDGGILAPRGSAQFGALVVTSNSALAFGPGPGVVSFADSSSQWWDPGATLQITNWAGSIEGEGLHRIFIGTNGQGLTAAQLERIRFVNPAGRLRGTYPATVLGTGEVVLSPVNTTLVSGWLFTSDPYWVNYEEPALFFPGPSTNVVAISAPGLALRADGTVVTWNTWPCPSAENYGFTDISAGYPDLALRTNGTVVAWDSGGLNTNVPPGLDDVVAVSAGFYASLALRSDGSIVAWGDQAATNIPAAAIPAIALSAGYPHFLALKANGTVVGWGQSTYGEADPPADLTNAIAICAGYFMSTALRADGTVVAWGVNDYGQSDVPPGLSNVVALSTGGFTTSDSRVVALRSDGTVVVWGSTNGHSYSGPPSWLTNVRAVSASSLSTLVLLEGGSRIQARLVDTALVGGVFRFTVPSRSAHVYTLETANSLEGPWQLARPFYAGRPGKFDLTDSSASTSPKFYRVREWSKGE